MAAVAAGGSELGLDDLAAELAVGGAEAAELALGVEEADDGSAGAGELAGGAELPGFLFVAAPPICILAILTALPSLVIWYRIRRTPAPMPEQANPTQLKSAVFFGGMYALVLVALAAVKEYAGDEYLYVVAGLSGLTDMDAITLSTARLVRDTQATDPAIVIEGWRMILVASLANLAFKAGIVGLMANRRLLAQIALLFSIPILGGVLLLLFM